MQQTEKRQYITKDEFRILYTKLHEIVDGYEKRLDSGETDNYTRGEEHAASRMIGVINGFVVSMYNEKGVDI